jgi:ribosome-associated toxin RatA of RatAB toxin-antitoxin module
MIASKSLKIVLLLSVLAVLELHLGDGAGAAESGRAQKPEVIVRDTLDGGYYAAGRLYIPALEAQVWDVISDYDDLAAYIPNMLESEVVTRQDSVIIVRQKIKSDYFLFSKTIELTLQIMEHPPNVLHFELSKGPFWYYRGGWRIVESSSSSGVVLSYHLLMKPDFFSPAFIAEKIMRQQLEKTLAAVEEETMKRHRSVH